MQPLENLVEGRHVYYWPLDSDHHVAAIVANVERDPVHKQPTGRVALTVLNRVGIPSNALDVEMVPSSQLPQGSGGWTWMFKGQEAVSTAGAKPTALEPAVVALADDPWAHRSAGMRCRTCMFYVSKGRPLIADLAKSGPESVTAGRELGRCRRHAPTMGGYPVVRPTDWCGDHKLDETKA